MALRPPCFVCVIEDGYLSLDSPDRLVERIIAGDERFYT